MYVWVLGRGNGDVLFTISLVDFFYPLWSNLSSSSLGIAYRKSASLIIYPICLAQPCPTPSPPERNSVDHAYRMSTWASTPGCTNCAPRPSPRMHQPGPNLGAHSALPTPGCCPQLGPIQVQGRVRGGAGGQETSTPSQGRPRPPSAAGEAVAMATPPPRGQRGRLPPGAGPDVSLGLSRRSGQFTAAGSARADCGAGQAEAAPAPPLPTARSPPPQQRQPAPRVHNTPTHLRAL